MSRKFRKTQEKKTDSTSIVELLMLALTVWLGIKNPNPMQELNEVPADYVMD